MATLAGTIVAGSISAMVASAAMQTLNGGNIFDNDQLWKAGLTGAASGAVAAGAQGLTGDLSQLQGVEKARGYLSRSMLTSATTNALHATLEGRLWDNKFRSNPKNIPSSPTFTPRSSTMKKAISDAQTAIRNSKLPDSIKRKAIQNLKDGNFKVNTPGSGSAKNSTTIRFCSDNPC